MRATAKFSDFIGTAAADFSDTQAMELGHYLGDKGVDIKRYHPIGVRFYAGYDYGDGFYAYIICLDTVKSKGDKEVQIQIAVSLTAQEFFSLIKRLEVVIYRKHSEHADSPAREVQLDDLLKE